MANAKKCDRCGKIYSGPYVLDLTVHKYHHCYGESRYDLCDTCTTLLEHFLNNALLLSEYVDSMVPNTITIEPKYDMASAEQFVVKTVTIPEMKVAICLSGTPKKQEELKQ